MAGPAVRTRWVRGVLALGLAFGALGMSCGDDAAKVVARSGAGAADDIARASGFADDMARTVDQLPTGSRLTPVASRVEDIPTSVEVENEQVRAALVAVGWDFACEAGTGQLPDPTDEAAVSDWLAKKAIQAGIELTGESDQAVLDKLMEMAEDVEAATTTTIDPFPNTPAFPTTAESTAQQLNEACSEAGGLVG